MSENGLSEETLRAVLRELFVDSDRHIEHHTWIAEQIESERARREMWQAITRSAISWSVPVALASVYAWLTGWFHR